MRGPATAELRLAHFHQPALPLGVWVKYAGLNCRIVGRSFGPERYDLESCGEHQHIFLNLHLSEFAVDFTRLDTRTEDPGHGN